jgi:hypothetical protein
LSRTTNNLTKPDEKRMKERKKERSIIKKKDEDARSDASPTADNNNI